MIKNLSQLKKKLVRGIEFKITEHRRAECIGQVRMVNVADTTGFYSIVPAEPYNRINISNGSRGSFLGWSKAAFWEFGDGGICRLYSSDKERSAEYLILGIQVLN